MRPDRQICVGCHRTLAEISDWSQMSGNERAVIMQDLPVRKAANAKRRGGRAARLQRS
jgi:predicted Fe-S protein YdhL (DUF1289 family)